MKRVTIKTPTSKIFVLKRKDGKYLIGDKWVDLPTGWEEQKNNEWGQDSPGTKNKKRRKLIKNIVEQLNKLTL